MARSRFTEGGLYAGAWRRVQGCAEQHVPRVLGGGHSAEFAQVAEVEEEEAELAWEGAGLQEPGIPSLPGASV